MADTDFDAFTDVTSLQSTDKFLLLRGASGINATLATLAAEAGKLIGDGTVALPGLAFASDPDTGLFRPSANAIAFTIGGVQRVHINNNGSVGIGTTSPSAALDVNGGYALINRPSDHWASTGFYSVAGIGQLDTGGSFETTLTSNGYRTSSGVWKSYAANGNAGAAQVSLNPAGFIDFRTDGTKANGSSLSATTRIRIEFDGTTRPGADNSQKLGSAAVRWSVVYAGTGTINTSDEREKLWIDWAVDRRAADRRIARRIMDEMGWFQWRHAVAEKSEDGARWHFGARAQRVWAIVADEGLCAPIIEDEAFGMIPDPAWQGTPPPAWLCYDVWDDEYEDVIGPITIVEQQEVTRALPGLFDKDGSPATVTETVDVEVQTEGPTGEQRLTRPAGNRFGFRIDQLGLLLDWALHDRLSETEARQDALNARLAALEAG